MNLSSNSSPRLSLVDTPFIIGIDEVGRGPLAGPVVAAAVAWPPASQNWPDGIVIGDSKKLSAKNRDRSYEALSQHTLWGLCALSPLAIDQLNIRAASLLAMEVALCALLEARRVVGSQTTQQVMALVDGNQEINLDDLSSYTMQQRCIIKGDSKEAAIGAASILAKVWRDRVMEELGQKYPQYGFEKHVGYPTAKHREAIAAHGPCEAHRFSFRTCRPDDHLDNPLPLGEDLSPERTQCTVLAHYPSEGVEPSLAARTTLSKHFHWETGRTTRSSLLATIWTSDSGEQLPLSVGGN